MPFTILSQRPGWPYPILAGPILRRVEKNQVTVWIALSEQQTVRLDVLDRLNNVVLTGNRETLKLGERLHVVAVTARSNNGTELSPGESYTYDLFNSANTSLFTVGDRQALTYGDASGPGFVFAPEKLEELRIAHSSCRKPHGEGRDMLAYLDELIADPQQRPHMLFLTGDQIYADDVADVLLFMIRDAVEALGFPPEQLSGVQPEDLKPGMRSKVANEVAKLTVDTDVSHSHLLTFGEFCAMYLMAWSPVLWPDDFQEAGFQFFFPTFNPVENLRLEGRFKDQKPCLDRFYADLQAVRRALANIPTYMMFDDHDVTDDLFLNAKWCIEVLGSELGHRVILNGLAAIVLFQSWGNTPEQFQGEAPGKKILDLLPDLTEQKRVTLHQCLGLPSPDEIDAWHIAEILALGPKDGAVGFHFTIEGASYRILFLNTRTHRAFLPRILDEPAELISQEGLAKQIEIPSGEPQRKALTFIVSPAPVFGIDWIDDAQWWKERLFGKAIADFERWNLSEACFGRFLNRTADLGTKADNQQKRMTRAVILSGDVHYGYAAQIQYSHATAEAAIAQFTASSLKNQTSDWKGTISAQARGYSFAFEGFPRDVPDPGIKKITVNDRAGCYHLQYANGSQDPATTFPALNAPAALNQAHIVPDGTQIVGFNNLGVITIMKADNGALSAVQTLHWFSPDGEPITTTYTVPLLPTTVTCP